MADLTLTCPHCSHALKVSEHIDAETVPCPSCDHPIKLPPREQESRLSLRKGESKEFLAPETVEPTRARDPEAELKGPAGMDRVHIARDKVRTPRAMVAWFAFLFVGGILLGLQYGIQKYPFCEEYYVWMRAGISVLCGIALLITAFEDSIFQGIFVLLIPFYAIYYVFVRTDSYFLRGAALALIVSLAAEIYFLGDRSCYIQGQEVVNNFIDEVSGLIDAAAAKPTY